jgi:glycerophosphoryl diester phosphodiesterase
VSLNLPQVIGHRGAALAAPENTLEGFREAAAQGAKWVEFDVGLSADGQCFVLHDDTLDRTTSGKGPAHLKSIAELKAYDAGFWFGRKFEGAKLPTLAETIALLTELDLMANVEIKGAPEKRHAALATAVMTELRKYWPASKPKPLISSFELECLRTVQQQAPEFPRGYLIWGREVDWLAKARGVAAATMNIDSDHATQSWMGELKQAGYGVLVYTVNAPERAARLIEWGADGVFTDAPGAILARLGKGV